MKVTTMPEQQFLDDAPAADEPVTERSPALVRRTGGFGQRGPNYDEAVYVISVAAELSDMHPQTLRTYEREGLVEPGRTAGNTRRYSQRDIDRLRFIRHLTQEEGLNLAGVRVVLDLGEKLESAKTRSRELEEMVRRLADRIQPEDGTTSRGEMVPSPARDIEAHPRLRRNRPQTARAPHRTVG